MIQLKQVCKTFPAPAGNIAALQNINLHIHKGEIYGIIGASGAGKSTLVRCINLLEKPDSGSVIIGGVDITHQTGKVLLQTRRRIAMIFQGYNLLAQRTCLHNVALPMILSGTPKKQAYQRAEQLLQTVGLGQKCTAYPSQLSGGQKQRVAIARALGTNPDILLCDEATSALDPETTRQILQLILSIQQQTGITVVIITHQMEVIEKCCNRVAILDGGTVVEEGQVQRVFQHPATTAAKRLVYPEGFALPGDMPPGGHYLRVVFNGAPATEKPLIAQMAVQKGIQASIISSQTRSIGNLLYGNMLLLLQNRGDLVAAAAYLGNTPDIITQEVTW